MLYRELFSKAGLALLISWFVANLPSPTEAMPLRLKNGLVGILFILYIGKLLYDTLFYDRYKP